MHSFVPVKFRLPTIRICHIVLLLVITCLMMADSDNDLDKHGSVSETEPKRRVTETEPKRLDVSRILNLFGAQELKGVAGKLGVEKPYEYTKGDLIRAIASMTVSDDFQQQPSQLDQDLESDDVFAQPAASATTGVQASAGWFPHYGLLLPPLPKFDGGRDVPQVWLRELDAYVQSHQVLMT